MENGKQPAFAAVCDNTNPYLQEGLTKREYFSAMIMQGLMSNVECEKYNLGTGERTDSAKNKAKFCVLLADALLKALEE